MVQRSGIRTNEERSFYSVITEKLYGPRAFPLARREIVYANLQKLYKIRISFNILAYIVEVLYKKELYVYESVISQLNPNIHSAVICFY